MPHLSSFSRHLTSIALAGAIAATGQIAFVAHPAFAQATVAPGNQSRNFSAADIETAEYTSGDLPAGQSALTAKVQILLDRAGISPGVVDGWRGGMSESAIKAYQRRANLPMDGRMSPVVWQLLQPFASEALTMDYTITEDDAHGLVDNIPSDYAEKAKMTSQGFTSISEKLAERFHMDEKFLIKLNPGHKFEPGVTIKATVPAKPIRATVTRIIVDKATRRVAAYDAKGNMVADYPATVGSTSTPSPHGTHTVDAVALNPTYTYNPNKNFKQGNNDRVLIVPPGPNGPVGEVWIDLSEPTYGIHGTATPSRLFVNQSYGCVRLTNWDARELAHMVKAKVTTVEFLEPGVSIADVTGGAAAAGANKTTAATTVASAISAIRPPARPQSLAINNTAPQSGTTVANGAATPVTPGPAGIAATPTTAAAAPGGAAQTGGAPVVAGDDLLSEAIAEAVSVNEPVTSAVLPAAGTAAAAIAPTLPPRRSTSAAKLPAEPPAPAQTPQPTTPQAAAAGIAPLVTSPLPAGN
ncbi:L,D-transpeptidase [Paracoccus sp. (in: a-proteobacteria)]|uniref:L,D-transpeptidase family protein n=1 Tax=Paracoccus sp. TaxID=267 RepID=UPI002897B7F8|nr:L,D-transpeptidase [Paracoccus sp. (in: a-proteobacteria)]